MPNLCILVHCKECQHTERSRSIQQVLGVPSPQGYPGDLEGHEPQKSQKVLGVPFSTRLVALVAQLHLFVLWYQLLRVPSRPSLLANLFLLDFQVNLGFLGNQFDQAVQALLCFPGCQEGQEDQLALESCYDIQKESG